MSRLPVEVDGFAFLSPMAGATDASFRRLARELGASMVYTELVSAAGIVRRNPRSRDLYRILPEERPAGVQLFGGLAEELADAAAIVASSREADLIDLNMGCPVPKVVSRGAGAALMRDPVKVERLVRAVADRIDLPVTAKIRAGWSDVELNAIDVAKAIEAGGGKAVAVHARPRSRGHKGEADWTLIQEVVRSVSIPVIGNGGVMTADDAFRMRNETGCAAVLIGRGALFRPWIFAEIKQGLGRDVAIPGRADVLCRHLALLKLAKPNLEEAQLLRRAGSTIQRYARSLHGAAAFRRDMASFQTFAECLAAFRALSP